MIRNKKYFFYFFFFFFLKILSCDFGFSKPLNEEDQMIHAGVGAFQDGFYDITEKHFSLFVKIFPNHSKIQDISYILGKTYLHQKKWKEAREAFSRIATDNKNFESLDYTLFWLAQIEFKLGNLEGCRKWLLLFKRISPEFEWLDYAYFLLGCLDFEENRLPLC